MNKEKGKFQEALKLFDNKEYRNAKKACEKILDKQPSHADALALKGLVMYHMNEKAEGTKTINDAIKLNIKNANAWHFFALLHKEDKNYSQAMRCYIMAQKNDQDNYNVVRDLSYLQLYLRQFNSFLQTARRGMEIRSGMLVNWTTYAFANYLTGNYDFAFRLLESCQTIGTTTIKNQDRHEIILFQSLLLIKQNKFEEALNFLLDNEKLILDKTILYERIIDVSMKLEKRELAHQYISKAMALNPENALYFIHYLNNNKGLNITSFEELLNLSTRDKVLAHELLLIIQELKPRVKSRIINRLELALSQDDTFRNLFSLYFLQNVKQNLPSFFINVKFIYNFQQNKLSIIEGILLSHLNSIKSSGKLDESLTNGELLNIIPNFIWVYYYAAQHFDYCRDLEKALYYINFAIDSTSSVVEFYMIKSRIFKHAGMLKEAVMCYDKAKRLDSGDRFLNAKCGKFYTRMGDITHSLEVMKEFVRDPLNDENAEHFQCMWYETECGLGYLQQKKFLRAHRLFKLILMHFNTLIEDQFDFYNYCLRRFMVSDFASTIEYMDRILDQKYVYKALETFEVLIHYLKNNNNDKTEKLLNNEYEEMQKEKLEKYKYVDIKTLVEEMENDIFNLVTKLQPFSKIKHFHHLGIKIFISRGKLLLAVKSLLFLQSHHTNSFEYLDSLSRLSNYLKEHKEKINPSIVDIVYEKLDLIKNEEVLAKFLNDEKSKLNQISSNIHILLTNAYESVFNNIGNLEQIIEKLLNNKPVDLRKIKSETFQKVALFLNLFCSEEFTQKFNNSLADKIKIVFDEKELTKNLTFFE